jgi:hypothetical protein
MELKSELLASATAEQTAFSASFVFIARSTKAPSAWKAISRSSCSLNDNAELLGRIPFDQTFSAEEPNDQSLQSLEE